MNQKESKKREQSEYQPGAGKWVFVDWVGIEPGYGTRRDGKISDGFCVPDGVCLKVHRPEVGRQMVIVPDKPWERNTLNPGGSGYTTFMKDEGLYRCWYESGGGLAYAESNDGINWEKPLLRLREVEGSKENNLCNISFHGHGIFIDPQAPRNERYKMVGCRYAEEEKTVIGAVSADGVKWERLESPLLEHPQEADTQNTALYDEKLNKYIIYTRNRQRKWTCRRGVNRTESKDFRNFPRTRPVLLNHPLDPPDWDIYCNGYSRWPGAEKAHIMRLSIYKRTSDTICVHLATSRDGMTWYRPLMGETPWFGGADTPFGRKYQRIYGCAGIVDNDDGTWSTYFSATDKTHNEPRDKPPKKSGILRGVIREDGFISLSARGHGRFYSVPFTLQGSTIHVNIRTRYSGYLKYGLLDEGQKDQVLGEEISGFSESECDPISGDSTNIALSWNGKKNLSHLQGKKIRMFFKMYKADLFSIKF